MNLGPIRTILRDGLEGTGFTWAPGPPRQVHLSVTDRCFLPCVHCGIHRNRTPDLPTRAWADIIDRLADWLGPVSANFVGGEPLMRPDLETLMARATGRGFQVSFNTNGWLLTPRRARGLSEAGVSIAYVSLDGMREETVDRTRGRVGAYRHARQAIENLEKVGRPRVIVASILHGDNADQMGDLLAFVRDRGHQLVIQPLYQDFGDDPHDPSWHERSPLWPRDPGPVHAALDLLLDARRSGGPVCNCEAQLEALKGYFAAPNRPNGLRCRAGYSDLAVDPRGRLRLCFFHDPIGDVAEGVSLERIWTRPSTLRARGRVRRCTRTCNLLNCNFES